MESQIVKKAEEKLQKRGGRGNLPPEYIGRPGPGRPKGSKNFETYFKEAWKEVAEALNLNQNPDKAKIEIIKLGFKRMFKGDYQFWRDFMDRLFGKAPIEIDVDVTQRRILEIETKILEALEKEEEKEKLPPPNEN